MADASKVFDLLTAALEESGLGAAVDFVSGREHGVDDTPTVPTNGTSADMPSCTDVDVFAQALQQLTEANKNIQTAEPVSEPVRQLNIPSTNTTRVEFSDAAAVQTSANVTTIVTTGGTTMPTAVKVELQQPNANLKPHPSAQPRIVTIPATAIAAAGGQNSVTSPYVQLFGTGRGSTLVTSLGSGPQPFMLQVPRAVTTLVGGSSILPGLHTSASTPALANGAVGIHINGSSTLLPRTGSLVGLSSTVPSSVVLKTADGRAKDNGEEVEEEEDELGVAETYEDYMPSKLNFGVRHPDPVVETSSLSSVEPPDVTYQLVLPKSVILSGDLSALQLEAVVYACQRHEKILPSGERAGFLIGDGAGVGKGRTIAGIIYENYLRGRKRAIWLSVSNDLKVDAERDLKDIGAKIPVYSLNKLKYEKISSKGNGNIKKGVIFATYSSLIGESQSSSKYRTRMKMLQKWCGENFDGLIVFDECHKAKNLCPAGSSKPTKTGQAVHDLQQQLPSARVVYASATGATEPRNMAYMTRLGLWGAGSPFREFNDFVTSVERRGVGAMELLAMEMKLCGMYIARQLSFKGVQFRVEDIPITKEFISAYNLSVKLFTEIREKLAAAAELLDPESLSKKNMWAQFWSAHQRFFKYLCISAKVSRVVQLSKEAVKNGKCVVIGLQSTGEARTLEQIEESGSELTDFVSTAKGVLQAFLEKHFPVADRSKNLDSNGGSTLSSIFSHEELQSIVKGRAANVKPNASVKIDSATKGAHSSATKDLKTASRDSSDDEERTAPDDSDSPSESDDNDTDSDDNDRFFMGCSDDDNPFGSADSDDELPWLKSSKRKRKHSLGKNSLKTKKVKVDTKKENSASGKSSSSGPGLTKKAPLDNGDDDYDRLCDQAFGKTNMLKKEGSYGGNSKLDIPLPLSAEGRPGTQEPNVEAVLKGWKEELLAKLEALSDSLPPNALDALVDELGGPGNVAEMTGRKGRVVVDDQGAIIYESRSENDVPLDQLNLEEKKRFMNGEKVIAVISEAASSGISLQSDRRAVNQRRRVHITLELPWSADRAIQQFGRTHRSNQVNAPEYVFLISELAGERRFASTVAKRLESLGALTHGDRRATESRDLSQFNIDNKYGRTALEVVMKSIVGLERPLVPTPEVLNGNFFTQVKKALIGVGLVYTDERNISNLDKDYNNISKFLNRILGIEVELQNALFKYFTDTLAAVILQAKRNGRWDLGILDIGSGGEQIKVSETWTFENSYGGSIAKTELLRVNVERGMTWEMAKKLYYEYCEEADNGFYMGVSEKPTAVLVVVQGSSRRDKLSKEKLCKIYRPHMGLSTRLEKLSDLKKRFKRVSPDVAEDAWTDQFEKSLTQCTHVYYRGGCRRVLAAGGQCLIGLRIRTYYVLTGSVLSVWSRVENVLSMSLPGGSHSKMQIVRLRIHTDNGKQERRIVGTIIPSSCVPALRSELSARGAAASSGTSNAVIATSGPLQSAIPVGVTVRSTCMTQPSRAAESISTDRLRISEQLSRYTSFSTNPGSPVIITLQKTGETTTTTTAAVQIIEDSVVGSVGQKSALGHKADEKPVVALDMPLIL